jgi:anaerobic ribonucleoside-triphosphate reductase activating protein
MSFPRFPRPHFRVFRVLSSLSSFAMDKTDNTDLLLRLHQFLPYSRANGPGRRAVVWVQGCTLGCPGCFNPETHIFADGEMVSIDDLFERLLKLGAAIEGVTVSGGEPFQQRSALLGLLRRIRAETPLSVLVFTGYSWEEVQRMPEAAELMSAIDVLIAGRYDQTERLARSLRGSTNKSVHLLTRRYSAADLDAVPPAEIIISKDGDVAATGIDPLKP